MVTEHPGLQPGVIIDPDGGLSLVARKGLDLSLTAQARVLVNEGLLTKNSLLLVTANSAIPVADAWRGILDVAHTTEPTIDYVKATRVHASYFAGHKVLLPTSRDEVDRLEGAVMNCSNVIITDQAVGTGTSLVLARQFVREASGDDTIHISYVRGNWWAELHADDGIYNPATPYPTIDFANVTVPECRDTMYEIGIEVGKRIIEGY